MASDRRPERPPARPVEPRPPHADRDPRRREAPIHHPDQLGLVEGLHDREHWWGELGANTRDTLLPRTGRIMEWWAHAYSDSNRPYAVVLGEHAFAIVRPTINAYGKPANRLSIWSLRPESHQSTQISGVSPGGSEETRAASRRPAIDPADPPADISLPAPMRGFLGNLPLEAQHRLQRPFLAGDLVRDSDFYYFGYPETMEAWCCLAGARTVTVASGTCLLIPGKRAAYSWTLTCRQVEVANHRSS